MQRKRKKLYKIRYKNTVNIFVQRKDKIYLYKKWSVKTEDLRQALDLIILKSISMSVILKAT